MICEISRAGLGCPENSTANDLDKAGQPEMEDWQRPEAFVWKSRQSGKRDGRDYRKSMPYLFSNW